MTPLTHPHAPLDAGTVRLEPLTPLHAPGLLTAADPDTFRWLVHRPETWDLAGFESHVRHLLGIDRARSFAVLVRTGNAFRVVGTTSYLDITPAHRSLEIGWTWLGPAARGTSVNPRMKLLMLTHALGTPFFDTGPAERVTLKTDANNTRSQHAMETLGFVREGTLRRHMIRPDGSPRDSVFFSVTQADWPDVRARLERAAGARPEPES